MFSVKEAALKTNLLQERQLTLEKAIKICNSEETTAQHLKDLTAATDSNEIQALKQRNEKLPRLLKDPRDPKGAKRYKYCGATSGGENVRRIGRLAEIEERVITSQKRVSSVAEGENRSTQTQSLPVTLVNRCLQSNKLQKLSRCTRHRATCHQ